MNRRYLEITRNVCALPSDARVELATLILQTLADADRKRVLARSREPMPALPAVVHAAIARGNKRTNRDE